LQSAHAAPSHGLVRAISRRAYPKLTLDTTMPIRVVASIPTARFHVSSHKFVTFSAVLFIFLSPVRCAVLLIFLTPVRTMRAGRRFWKMLVLSRFWALWRDSWGFGAYFLYYFDKGLRGMGLGSVPWLISAAIGHRKKK